MLTAKMNGFTTPDKKENVDFLLFCFPFAGAGASYFNSWALSFKETPIQLCGVQYPGRENRIKEPLINDASLLVNELSQQISALTTTIPFAFYGHSMGATIAYEVALALADHQQPQPEFLCLSGRNPPHTPKQSKDIDHLSDTEFIREIERLGNLPRQIIDDPELMAFLLPIMRNDASLLRNYKPQLNRTLKCPLYIYGGDNDPYTNLQALSEWDRYTTTHFDLKLFSGNHFFINRHKPELCALIKKHIEKAQ